MITFDHGGGLGNRIFQYVSARLLAEKLGYSLESPCPVKNVLDPSPTKSGCVYRNDRIHVVENTENGNILEAEWGKRHIHLQGYWQIPEMYIKNREKVLVYFREKTTEYTDKRNIVMHVRLGDYKVFGPKGNVIDPKYYHDCLEREQFDRLFIVTDSSNDEYLKAFESYKPTIISVSEKHDFWAITEFDRIIIGNSTFSWWAAFLSNATKIYTPGCWIRNSIDIKHDLYKINNGKCEGIVMDAGFKDYN